MYRLTSKLIVYRSIDRQSILYRLADICHEFDQGHYEKEDLRGRILDEINRVDISRVFGELFTAMEKDYRDTGVDLPVTEKENEPLQLRVPENLYIIGTMNMIDFSL